MSAQDKDEFGNRMKSYERADTGRRAERGLPIVARLDGKSFHTFTKGLKRPFDLRLTNLMIDTMLFMVERTGADLGYVQSDEISLTWYVPPNSPAEYLYGGRFQKMDSLLAAMCTAFFNKQLAAALPEKADAMPVFDCRTFNVPTIDEAVNAFVWRQQDCLKNAISMAAQSMFSHKSLQGLSGREMLAKMEAAGFVFTDTPAAFRHGTFGKRVVTNVQPDADLVMMLRTKGLPVPDMISRTVMEPSNMVLGNLPAQARAAVVFGEKILA